jgi:hypothetical protein
MELELGGWICMVLEWPTKDAGHKLPKYMRAIIMRQIGSTFPAEVYQSVSEKV